MRSDTPASVYALDSADRIRSANAQWDRFAKENDAPALVGEAIFGRSIWEYVEGPEVRHLYKMLMSSAREGRTIRIPFRCDAPEKRRFMKLEIRPQADNGLELTAVLLREETRPRVALLDPRADRRDEFLSVCSWCRGVLVEHRWVEVEAAIEELDLFGDAMPRISHGICPDCVKKLYPDLVPPDENDSCIKEGRIIK